MQELKENNVKKYILEKEAITDKTITNYTVGPKVAALGKCVFYNCPNLIAIKIAKSVASIGEEAFFFKMLFLLV